MGARPARLVREIIYFVLLANMHVPHQGLRSGFSLPIEMFSG